MLLYSFIIAVYNVEKYLEECLDSVLGQTYQNWEAILIDDGSTDANTSQICDKYAQKDSRFKVYHRNNEGSLMARRYGISQAKGDFVIFIDSDDYVDISLLEYVNNIILQHECDMVIYRYQMFDGSVLGQSEVVFKEGTIIGEGGLSKELIWKKVISGSAMNNLCLKVSKRSNLDLDADYSKYKFMCSSTDFMQSLPILDNSKRIYFTEKILYNYRANNQGITAIKKSIDLCKLDVYLKTNALCMEKRLLYLKKNKYDSDENLKIFYKFYFTSMLDTLVSRLVNIDDKKEAKYIIERTLNNESLKRGLSYVEKRDINGYYVLFYIMYKKESDWIIILLKLVVMCTKIKNKMYNVLVKIKS